jgi:hypothetical protein
VSPQHAKAVNFVQTAKRNVAANSGIETGNLLGLANKEIQVTFIESGSS